LADRNILVDQPKDGVFSVFGDARAKIENGAFIPGREIYFALYQSLAEGENREGLFRKYPKDYFDLIIIDECHRGSAKETSTWKEILRYFDSAVQLGRLYE
jgi:type I restriction enzyme R subunit